MRILLDTHIWIWALTDPSKLAPKARDALEDPDNEILFSAASVWEFAIKHGLGRADFAFSPDHMIQAAVATGFVERPVTSKTAAKAAMLPHHHRDPFDRLLVAQAMTEPAMLYTADVQLSAYSEMVVCWNGAVA
jgi:PIN domain nuclease of toxin-antitoxin system